MKTQFKRLLSGVLSAVMTMTAIPSVLAHTEESIKLYPYTMFAASSDEGAITVNNGNFCVNGDVATNGTITSSGNTNINGTKTENAEDSMIFIFNKIDTQYFSSLNVDAYEEDFLLEEQNININVPTEVLGETTLTGNVNINSALKSLENINLYGEVKNTNNSVIFSKYGDIVIDSQNTNLNGLVYAPFGSVTINAQNLNLNNVVIIAESIVLNCPSVNANYSSNVAAFVGNDSEPLDISQDEWQYMDDKDGNGCPDFFENPNNWKLLSDTDGEGIPDPIEIIFGSDINKVDTDMDGLNDFYEVFTLLTDPTIPDTDHNGISDYNEDFDIDGLSNGEEFLLGTEPELKDTDKDNLTDGDEVKKYYTNPLLFDTDSDGISDGDEIKLNTDPKAVTENTRNSFTKTFTPVDFGFEEEEFIPDVEFTSDAKGILTFEMEYRNSDLAFNRLTPGYIANCMNFSTEGEFGSAILKYHISDEMLNDEDFEPAIYYFNEEKQCLEELPGAVLEGNTLSVTLEHFSSYAIMNKKAFDKKFQDKRDMINYLPLSDDKFNTQKMNTDVMFVLDDSGSMDYNDPYNMRKSATVDFVKEMPDTDNVGIYSFTATNPQELLAMTPADEDCQKKCETALNKLRNSYTGTDGSWGLYEAIEKLKNSDNIKCIIFLTDGEDTTNRYSYDSIIQSAIENHIIIFTIGLTYYTNEETLNKIATQTGGKFFSISNMSELSESYNQIKDLTIDYITDSNNDNLSDYYTWKLCSGQITDGMGNEIFPFGNPYDLSESNIDYTTIKTGDQAFNAYKKNAEALYKRVQDNDDFDGDHVKNGDEIMILNVQQRCFARISSNPSIVDTDSDGVSDYDEHDTYGSAPDKFSAICEFNQYNILAYDDYYIASIYKDQMLNGNIINNLGLAISHIYSRNLKHDIYVKEVSNALTRLYSSYDNKEYKDAMTYMTLNDAKNVMVYLRTIYAADFSNNIDNMHIGEFNIAEYTKAQKAFIDAKKAEKGLESCTDSKQINEWANEFLKSTNLMEFETVYDLKTATKNDVQSGLKRAFKNKGDIVLRGMDLFMAVLGGVIEGVSTADDYVNLQFCADYFNDSEEILTKIQNRTHNSGLSNALDDIIPALQDSKKMANEKFLQEVTNGIDEALYEGVHSIISWCGNVGAVIEVGVSLGNLTGIPETAQYVHRTCCAASMSDCLAAVWKDEILNNTMTNSNGIRYTNESYSSYADPFEIINDQRYIIALRLEANDNFISMETAGLIPTLKQLLNKQNVKDAEQVKRDLSYEVMKKAHYFIDARIYTN